MFMKLSSQLQQSFPRLPAFLALMRLNKPIGIYLLLWPTLWALWIAAEGWPDWRVLIIFICGVILMRSAGCVINDFADRDFDGHVSRTKERPLVTGIIKPREAIILFSLLCLLAFGLVLLTNPFTVYLSFGGLALASIYPFMKRHTYLPQVVLGAAFAWSIPMAFAAQTNAIADHAWLIYIATLLWTVAYDTEYAMTDREEDIKIGVKSTAILFGDADKTIIGLLQVFTLMVFVMLGLKLEMTLYYYLGLVTAAGLFFYQQYLISEREPNSCFNAFLNNHWAGLAIFLGIFLHYYTITAP